MELIDSHVFRKFDVTMGTGAPEAVSFAMRLQYVCNANTGPGILANKNTGKISQSEFVIFPINSENQVKWIHFNA